MGRFDLAAIVFFAVSIFAALGGLAYVDRERTIDLAEERTHAVARMMAAHAGAAIGEAAARVVEIAPAVSAWDLRDPEVGRDIFDRITAATQSPSIGAIGVMDLTGISRLNSWKYPSDPVNISDREYFGLHINGLNGPILDGDRRPGPISRRIRFTYSVMVRDLEGDPHAIIVVAIFADVFNALYREAVRWPAARATLFAANGDELAAMEGQGEVSDAYRQQILDMARASTDGSAILPDREMRRLVSWSRIDGPPSVIATSSQVIDVTLREWRVRTGLLALLGVVLTAGFALLLAGQRRIEFARRNADYCRMTVAEVHHRVKNALQLPISMLGLLSRRHPDQRPLLDSVSGQLVAVAEIQNLLQHDETLDRVDIVRLIGRLCRHLQQAGAEKAISYRPETADCAVDTARATQAAIVVNELLTNALKHARSTVVLTLACEGEDIVMTVRDDGRGVGAGTGPEGSGFGLRMIAMIAARLGGTVAVADAPEGGAEAVLRMPRKVDEV